MGILEEGARRPIIHKAGCPAPSWYGPGMLRKARFPEPVRTVADGRGGTMRACSLCGENDDNLPPAADASGRTSAGRYLSLADTAATEDDPADGIVRAGELDPSAIHRERARRMADWADQRIGQEIRYDDHADRLQIWRFVHQFRAQDGINEGGNTSIDLDPQAGLDYSASSDSDEHQQQTETFGQRPAMLPPEPSPDSPGLRIVPAEHPAMREQPRTMKQKRAIAAWPEKKAKMIEDGEPINISTAAKALGTEWKTMNAWVQQGLIDLYRDI